MQILVCPLHIYKDKQTYCKTNEECISKGCFLTKEIKVIIMWPFMEIIEQYYLSIHLQERQTSDYIEGY